MQLEQKHLTTDFFLVKTYKKKKDVLYRQWPLEERQSGQRETKGHSHATLKENKLVRQFTPSNIHNYGSLIYSHRSQPNIMLKFYFVVNNRDKVLVFKSHTPKWKKLPPAEKESRIEFELQRYTTFTKFTK